MTTRLAFALALFLTCVPAVAASSVSNATAEMDSAASTCAKYWPDTVGDHHQHCETAVAICLAESGGNCKATNVNTGGSRDRGLWQINDYWHKEVADSCAYDCACNAKEAYRISSSGSSWTQWSTYKSGAYKSHLSTAKAACENRVASSASSASTSTHSTKLTKPDPVQVAPVVAFDDIHAFLRDELNTTYDQMFPAEPNGWKYWYDQKSGHFHGETDLDPSGHISVIGCSGALSCGGRNNPAKQCVSQCGPLPRGVYQLSADTTYHNMEHCYVLNHVSGDECGRGGFLIHGGSCSSGDPSIGCIVIEDVNVRYKIRGGGQLTVKEG